MARVLRFYIPIHKVLERPWRNFTFLKLCKCYQIPPTPLRTASTPNKTKINHNWLNHLQTRLRHLARGRSEWKLSNPWGDKRKCWTHLPFSFHLINTRNKKENLPTRQIRLTRVTNSWADAHKSWIARCFPPTLGL